MPVLLRIASVLQPASSTAARASRLTACTRDHQRSPRLVAAITSTGQSHTYWPEAHRARCIQCIQTSAVLQGGQAPARPTAAQTSSLEHEHPLRTCSHCTKSCGNRGHTPHSRRALREARNRRAQHAGRRTTTRKRPSVHQKNAARRVTNAQALGISLIFTLKRTLCHPCTDAAFLRRRRRARHEEHAQNAASRRRARPTSRSSRPTATCPAPSVYCTPCARAARGGPS